MGGNGLAERRLTTRQDAAWHDCGDELVSTNYPRRGGNGTDPQRMPQVNRPAQDQPAARSPVGALREPPTPHSQNGNGATNGVGISGTNGTATSGRRIAPRSPRTAIEPEQVKMPMWQFKRAHNPLVMVANALFSIVLVIALIGGVTYVIGKQRFEMAGPLTQEKIVVIPRNSGVRDIADLLEAEGVIDQPWLFIGGVVLMKAREDLKYGEYQFPARASLRDVVSQIMSGRVIQHAFTVPEGLTSEQIVARLSENDVLSGDIRDIPHEGTLMPETYKFTRGVTREQMIVRMKVQRDKLVHEIWERRMPGLPLNSPEQLVTLASIVEKETGKPEERSRVAAVFINRLKQKMKLQSDPTIIYGLVGGKGTLGRPILRSEIERATPYNTYVIEGLPPGPIANPGRASLEAVANPARTKELYFVADGTGGHAFADTYEQHQKNVAHLRQIEQQANPPVRAAAPAPPLPAAR